MRKIKTILPVLIITILVLFGSIAKADSGAFYSTASDGYIGQSGATYSSVRGATSGTVYASTATAYVGQKYSSNIFGIYRSYLIFDTSSLPDDAIITGATLELYAASINTNFNVTIQNGQPTYPHDPLQAGDFNQINYSGSGGSFAAFDFNATGYSDVSLNSTGLGWISKTGATRLALRSDNDINNIAPTGSEYLGLYPNEGGVSVRPKLTVNYTTGGAVPDTSITANPANPTNQTTAAFNFTGTNSPTGYQCQLDSGGYAACASPKNYTVAQGNHTFQVKAVNAFGEDLTPASYTWLVDTTLPVVSAFDVQPRTLDAANPTTTITWTVTDSGGSYLDHVEVWRAPDSGGSPGIWAQVGANYNAPVGVNSWTSSATDSPADGTYWYGLHVLDKAGNQGTESSPIQITKNIPAGPGSNNVSGWAWSKMDDPLTANIDEGQIGWISFNGSNYGVAIDSNGNFSGYAWSENIGWIDFVPAGPYPASPNYSAKMDISTGQVSGWARVLSYGGGWDGWIKLRGTNYGVDVSITTGDFSGYAWSDAVIGWISFSGANYKVKTPPASPPASNRPPDKPNAGSPPETWNNCAFIGKSIPTFYWIYSDPDGDAQAAYEIEVDDNNLFNAPKFNHLVNLAATSYVLNLAQDDTPDWLAELSWGVNYFWRVKVKDSQGNWSDWSNSNQFTTPEHAYPYPDFTFTPLEPAQGETVDFDSSASQIFDGTSGTYLWAITQGTGSFVASNPNSQYPHIQFSTLNNKVQLTITDSYGYYCASAEKDVAIQLPLPEYKEVPPIFWAKKFLASLVDLFNLF